MRICVQECGAIPVARAHLAERGDVSTRRLRLCRISGREGGLWACRHLGAARTAKPAAKPARQGPRRRDLLLALGCCCCGSGRGCWNPPRRTGPGLPREPPPRGDGGFVTPVRLRKPICRCNRHRGAGCAEPGWLSHPAGTAAPGDARARPRPRSRWQIALGKSARRAAEGCRFLPLALSTCRRGLGSASCWHRLLGERGNVSASKSPSVVREGCPAAHLPALWSRSHA